MIMSIPFLFALTASPNPCIPVEGERVYVRDLVSVIPDFAVVPGDVPLGYVPVPGARRIITGPSLQALARIQGLELEQPRDVCFVLRMSPLAEEKIHTAIIQGYGEDQARIEVKAWGPEAAPQGNVVFPRGGLQLPADRDPNHDALWRGYVLYGSNRKFGVWARVRIAIPTTQVVAISDIPAGTAIRDDQVRLAATETSALDDRLARSLEQVVGFVCRKSMRAGAVFLRNELDRIPEVAKGDTVTVRASEGAAQLVLSAEAVSAGSLGSMIWVKNPTSGKGFRARVTGKDTVAVTTLDGVPVQ